MTRDQFSSRTDANSVLPRRFPSLRPSGVEVDYVLLVDSDPRPLRALRRVLGIDGHRVEVATRLVEVEARLADPRLAVVLIDLSVERSRDLELLDRIRRDRYDVEIVVVADRASVESAVACMRGGAFDYLAKPLEDVGRVRDAVKRALQRVVRKRRRREFHARETPQELPLSLDAYEKLALERALREVGGDASAVARVLGMGRSTLYRKLAKHGLGGRRATVDGADPRPLGLGAAKSIG